MKGSEGGKRDSYKWNVVGNVAFIFEDIQRKSLSFSIGGGSVLDTIAKYNGSFK